MNQTQLEELFRRTSAFTVKTANLNINMDDQDQIELLCLENGMYDELNEEWYFLLIKWGTVCGW